MPNSALPDHLKGKLHTDWTFPFYIIPRAWTSFKLFQPPVVLIGHKVLDWVNEYGKFRFANDTDIHWFLKKPGANPCQRIPGAWYLGFPWYFTWTIFDTGWYVRVGFRWDDIDSYYTFPSFRVRKIDGGLK